PLFPVYTPKGFQSALPKSNLDVLREILRRTTKPNLPLVVPKISYLHHGLLGSTFGIPRQSSTRPASIRQPHWHRHLVAVGTTIAGRPLRRSVRARLRIRL